jgi:hypothetical protein
MDVTPTEMVDEAQSVESALERLMAIPELEVIFETVTGTVVVLPDVSVTIKLYVPLAETV